MRGRLAGIAVMVLLTMAAIWLGVGRIRDDVHLDGTMAEWKGTPLLVDCLGDGNPGQDLKAVHWKTVPGEERLFFMVERAATGSETEPFSCLIYLDIDNNGSYQNRVDKFVQIDYLPMTGHPGKVTARIYQASGTLVGTLSGAWGEAVENGGSSLEIGLPMENLGVVPRQTIRFFVTTMGIKQDHLPDRGDIQWTPFPGRVTDRVGITVAILIWLFYYLWGAVGMTCLMTLVLRGTMVEYGLERQIGAWVHQILSHMDILTYAFDKAPGTLLVLIKLDKTWTTIDIDLENSSMLEMCIFVGLVMFYPAYSLMRRLIVSLTGVAAILAANVARLLAVIAIICHAGRNWSFVAHTIIGRAIFFFAIVIIYWQLITKPSLKKIGEMVKSG